MSAQDNLSPQQFYHSSRHNDISGAEWVHVGTRTAAENRARDWTEERHRRGEPESPAYMHTVEIHGLHSLATETDEVANAIEHNPAEYSSVTSEYKVIPYTNEFEDPGTTSYLVHRSALKSVKTEPMRGT